MQSTFLTKAVYVLALIVLSYLILHSLKFYFVPVAFAGLFAMLMLPLCSRLERWNFPPLLAAFLCLLLILSVIAIMVAVFSAQVVSFAKALPEVGNELKYKFNSIDQWFQHLTGYSSADQMNAFNGQLDQLFTMAGGITTKVLVATGGTMLQLGLMMVHFILFLLYRHRIKEVSFRILPTAQHETAVQMFHEITRVTQRYLSGVLIVMSVLAVLNSVGLLIIGLHHAIVIGVFAAVLNVIPYVGVWTAAALAMLYAFATEGDNWYMLAVLLVFFITHFLDANILTPKITGSKIRLNPMATLAAIIFGELTWGIAGMILFIPLLGIAKIIFSHVETLKPLSDLIGDDELKGESRLMKALKKMRMKKSAQKG
ncbi:MAG TPA: AI-2E family transporter [Chitinophagales bacterium]|nr:AI-2E family transporter [Chitinophagales bacterium]